MTNKNRKRNFLAGALATALIATLILGVGKTALAGGENPLKKKRLVVKLK